MKGGAALRLRSFVVTDETSHETPSSAAGGLLVDQLPVAPGRMRKRVLNRLFGALVEGQTMNLALLALELVLDAPADRFAFAVRAGRDVDVGGIFGRVSQLLDDLLARR